MKNRPVFRKNGVFGQALLIIKHPFSRICFGSDVPIGEMACALEEYRALFKAMSLPDEMVPGEKRGSI